MKQISIYLIISCLSIYCTTSEHSASKWQNAQGNTIATRFEVPTGYKRHRSSDNSFAYYLQNLALKPLGTQALLYDGKIKKPLTVYEAVVDLPIGHKNLQQCADAVIRLRAEYLFKQKKFSAIEFHFTNGDLCAWQKYAEGYRPQVLGNQVKWAKSAAINHSKENFWQYLELVFTYAGTRSLNQELKPQKPDDIQIGDVWIQAGSPGHAVIVVDMAINPQTQEKIFLLAQSYMPAQDIQILKNWQNPKLSPWYELPQTNELKTPEWSFELNHLKRF
jgi:hypothetical protein